MPLLFQNVVQVSHTSHVDCCLGRPEMGRSEMQVKSLALLPVQCLVRKGVMCASAKQNHDATPEFPRWHAA